MENAFYHDDLWFYSYSEYLFLTVYVFEIINIDYV